MAGRGAAEMGRGSASAAESVTNDGGGSLSFLLYVPLITMRVTAWEQGAVAIVFIALGVTSVRLESDQPDSATSESLHLFLLTLSSLMTLRYLYYRTTYTLNFDGVLNSIFILLLYVAEPYAIATLFLSYFQTLKIRDRMPVSLTPIPVKDWLKVDIYSGGQLD